MAERTDVSTNAPAINLNNSSENNENRRNCTRKQHTRSEETCATSYTSINNENGCLTSNHSSLTTDNNLQTQADSTQRKKKRIKWTKEMNKQIIRCYYIAIKDPTTAYRKTLHAEWLKIYPDSSVTEQRVCDQKKEIFKHADNSKQPKTNRGCWLTKTEIDDIKDKTTEDVNNIQPEKDERENANRLLTQDNMNAEEIPKDHNLNKQKTQENIWNRQTNGENLKAVSEMNIINKLKELFEQAKLTPLSKRKSFKSPHKKIEHQLKEAITVVNDHIEAIATDVSDLHELNCLIYASVILAIELSNLENQCYVKEKKKINNRKDNWKQSFQRKVNSLRADISKIIQINNQNPSIKIRKNNAEMKRKHKIYSERKRLEVLEKLKQQLTAKNNRLQRFIKREKQFQQNNAFVNKPKIFYRELRGTKIDIDQAPNIETIDNFWRPIFENEKSYNKNSTWIKEYEDSINIEQQQHTNVTEAEIQASINKFANWKSPGIDKIQNFWWKHFTKIHHRFSQLTSNVILNPENTPSWLTTGRTTLIPKSIKCDNPSKFRPITCLPIMYKIISSVINIRLLQHLSIKQS